MQNQFSILKFGVFFLIISGLTLFSCKTKSFTPDNFKGAQIVFGSGGGFTGAIDKFLILENGQVFKSTKRKKTLEEKNRFKKKELTTIFEECKTIMSSYDIMDEPGNLYYFISYKNGEDISRIVWGDDNQDPSPEVLDFYKKLQSLVQ